MSSQIRLRLTGAAGGGTCVLLEEGGRLRYRLSLEGPPGGDLTVLEACIRDSIKTVTLRVWASVCTFARIRADSEVMLSVE